ncbi:MAG: hypothetical protein JNJ92_11830 [Altererythrobacter sp.]|nr:hypothetical protein [Altererythrobacter sp.]
MRVLALGLVIALAACASSPRPNDRQRAFLGEAAEPSAVIATDLAFARGAREDGQWTAFGSFAAEGALIHEMAGPVAAAPWLAGRANPKPPVQWTPTAVWSSCDGQTTVTYGTSREPDGTWGYYATVWERQKGRAFRWVYRIAAPNLALTERVARRPEPVEQDDGAIVVSAYSDIRAEVAQCGIRGDPPAPRAASLPDGARSATRYASDRTLLWRWEHRADGTRRLTVDIVQQGAWIEALAFEVSPANQVVR